MLLRIRELHIVCGVYGKRRCVDSHVGVGVIDGREADEVIFPGVACDDRHGNYLIVCCC